ncbi:MAG: acyl-CoA synthetase FdrA [Myxococcota bacterium]|jgi:FdrA protein|nr:acyl-CoA synthetase FdrA [Myxococcota bacterium]
MLLRTSIIEGRYLDSVLLMSLAAQLKSRDGVADASAMMGTDANKAVLRETKMLDALGEAAGPSDLIVAIMVEDEALAAEVFATLPALLEPPKQARGTSTAELAARTLDEAKQRLPEASLVVISIPGVFVKHEALRALDLGLHPFIFSDNVSVEDEIELKTIGRERGLLVMGPDCGTSILNGMAIGFANVVSRGAVGIVGASGTGIQELSCLLDHAGVGVHQAIGVGGRDLSQRVGGLSMRQGIALLAADPKVSVLALVSKPPHPEVARQVLLEAKACGKPVMVCFLGGDPKIAQELGLHFAPRLDFAAQICTALVRGEPVPTQPDSLSSEYLEKASELAHKMPSGRKLIRALYSGGTLCDEAIQVADKLGLEGVRSNLASEGPHALSEPGKSEGNCFLDLGDDYFTRGRPHPMIDFASRRERIAVEAAQPDCAVILLDVVLGYGSHADPAGELVAAISALPEGGPVLVASITGTHADPQNYGQQRARLQAAGVHVLPNNASAAAFATAIVKELLA